MSVGTHGCGEVETQRIQDDQVVGGDLSVVGSTVLAGLVCSGAVAINNTLTVGINGTGHDVTFYGDTSGKYWMWDQSADKMIVAGLCEIHGGTSILGNTTFGASEAGVDVTFYGATAGKYAQWDASADSFSVVGPLVAGEDIKITGVVASNVTTILKNSAGNALLASCATANIPTGAGFAKGCLLIATDGTTQANTLFANIGDATTANFNAVTIAAD